MTWLAPSLNRRVQIGRPIQIANDDGGFDFSFDVVLTVWMGIKPITFKGAAGSYIRGEQINEINTHKFTVRKIAVDSLGKEYGVGFSGAFRYMTDLMPLKSDYFLFLQQGSTIKGRLFRIHEVTNKDERNECLIVNAEEIEEKGTGYPV